LIGTRKITERKRKDPGSKNSRLTPWPNVTFMKRALRSISPAFRGKREEEARGFSSRLGRKDRESGLERK